MICRPRVWKTQSSPFVIISHEFLAQSILCVRHDDTWLTTYPGAYSTHAAATAFCMAEAWICTEQLSLGQAANHNLWKNTAKTNGLGFKSQYRTRWFLLQWFCEAVGQVRLLCPNHQVWRDVRFTFTCSWITAPNLLCQILWFYVMTTASCLRTKILYMQRVVFTS